MPAAQSSLDALERLANEGRSAQDLLASSPLSRAAGRRVADLHDATGGRPERSPRFKQYSAVTGFRSDATVRVTLSTATRPLTR
jgi:hypothetical protein